MKLSVRIFGKHGTIIHDTRFKLLFLANANGALGIPLMSPILDSLTAPFGVSTSQIGLLITVYTAPGILMIPLGGILADKFGRKPMLCIGLILFGLGGSAISITTDFTLALILRLIQGTGFAGIMPIVITSIGDIYEAGTEETAQGIQFAALGMSTSVVSVLAGVLVTFSWRYPLFIYLLAFPVAVMVYIWFEEPLVESTPAKTDFTNGKSMKGYSQREYARDLIGIVTNPHSIAILGLRFVPSFIFVSFLTLCSFMIVHVLDGTSTQTGIIVGTASLIHAVSSTQAGRIAGLFSDQLYLLFWANLTMVTGFILFGVAPSFMMAILGTAFLGIGFGLASGIYYSVVTGLAPTEYRGGLVSFSESIGRLSSTVAPLVIGSLLSLGVPLIGYTTAIRWIIAGTGISIGGLGICCLTVALVSSPPKSATN